MSSRAIQVVIDARPRGPRGLLAAEIVLGRSVFGPLLDLAATLRVPADPLVVHAPDDEHSRLRELAGGRLASGLTFVSGTPRDDQAVLRTDCLYDAGRLRRSLKRGRSPETAILWHLDRPEALLKADEELTRRLTYQPLGKYWAFPLAERLAARLRPTSIRPNALTAAAGALMLIAAGLVAVGADTWLPRSLLVLALAAALVLDTADGRLARLQGTSSAFGRWLDQVLDELADLSLHAAIAWAAFCRDGQPFWLALGMLYASAKYLFMIQSHFGNELEAGYAEASSVGILPGAAQPSEARRGALARVVGLVRMIGHADLRWHLWIVLALCGRLDLALGVYACYFAARALAGAVRKGIRYA
jgi:phosphatidylglycerophosphate synthase